MFERHVNRRDVLRSGAGVLGLLALAGCGAGTATQPSSAPSVDSEAADYLRKTGKELGVPNISILAYASPQAESIQDLSPQFTELTGIKIDWTILDEQSAANKAAVALGSSGGGYDIVHVSSPLMPTYSERSWLAPLDDLVEKHAVPGWDPKTYGTALTGLLSGADEKLLASPMFIGTQMFFYRTDIFEKAGIAAPPTTYAELADVCKKVHGDDVSAIALRSAPSTSQMMFNWSAWLYAEGGGYYRSRNSDGTYADPVLNSPEAVAALTRYSDLLQKYAPTGATNWSVEDAVRSFTSGQVAMVQEGAVFGGTFNDKTKSQVAGKVGTFVLPKGPAGTFVPFVCHGWGVAANSKKMEAAGLFAQWATLEDTLIAATEGKTPFSTPALSSVYESKPYQDRFGFDDYVKSVVTTIETANAGGVSPIDEDPNYLPGTPKWNSIGQRACEELSRAVTGQATPQQAVERAAAALNS